MHNCKQRLKVTLKLPVCLGIRLNFLNALIPGKKQSLSWLTYYFWVFTFRMEKSLLAFDIYVYGVWIQHKTLLLVFNILITVEWKSDETLVFDVRLHGVSIPHKTLRLVFDILLTSLGARYPRVL